MSVGWEQLSHEIQWIWYLNHLSLPTGQFLSSLDTTSSTSKEPNQLMFSGHFKTKGKGKATTISTPTHFEKKKKCFWNFVSLIFKLWNVVKVTSLKIITNGRTNTVNKSIILTQVSTVQLVTFLVSNCRIEIPWHKFTPPDMTSLTMNNKSKLSPYTLLNIVSISKFSIVILQRTCWKKHGVIYLRISAVWTKHGFYSMFPFHKRRKHISLHYKKLQELFTATTSTAKPLTLCEESAPTLFLTIPRPNIPFKYQIIQLRVWIYENWTWKTKWFSCFYYFSCIYPRSHLSSSLHCSHVC